jgi:hypothetical protein
MIIARVYVQMDVDNPLKATVRSLSNADTSYRTELFPASKSSSCADGLPTVTSIPCKHVAAHIVAAGLRVEDYIPTQQTTDGWRLQYPDRYLMLLEEELNETLFQHDLKLPPALLANKKGRPKRNSRVLSLAERLALGHRVHGTKPLHERRTTHVTASRFGMTVQQPQAGPKFIRLCSNCAQEGHDKRSCLNPPVDQNVDEDDDSGSNQSSSDEEGE